jgi:hypothetical protein
MSDQNKTQEAGQLGSLSVVGGSAVWDTTAPGFTFWKTRIAAALRLWRSGFEIVALDHMQACQKAQPELYADMVAVAECDLDEWPKTSLPNNSVSNFEGKRAPIKNIMSDKQNEDGPSKLAVVTGSARSPNTAKMRRLAAQIIRDAKKTQRTIRDLRKLGASEHEIAAALGEDNRPDLSLPNDQGQTVAESDSRKDRKMNEHQTPIVATEDRRLVCNDLLAGLRKRRKQWRTEATRLRKWANGETSPSHRDRCIYEMNIYEACANQIDRDISFFLANNADNHSDPKAP